MKVVKQEYRKPRLELYSPNYKREQILVNNTKNSAFNIKLSEKVNETSTLTFDMRFNNTKLTPNDCEKLVKLNGEYYIIKSIDLSDTEQKVLTVNSVHESEELKGILCTTIDVIGATAEEMFNAIIEASDKGDILGYKFKTDISSSTKRALQVEEETSIFENLVSMAERFQATLEFFRNGFGEKVVFLRKNPIKRGKFIKKSSGMKNLNINFSTEELFTRVTPFGYTDSDGLELNIMDVNPTGKAYIEDYSYFKAKGMSEEEIMKTPRCLQEIIYRNSEIVDPNDLLREAQEELKKCSKPQVNGSVSFLDLSVFEGSTLYPPILNEEIIVIDKDINYAISCTITGIERDFENPLNTSVTISNVVTYKSIFKDLQKAGETIDKITTIDPNGGKTSVIAGVIKGKIDAAVTSFGTMLDSIEAPESKVAILFENRIPGDPNFGA